MSTRTLKFYAVDPSGNTEVVKTENYSITPGYPGVQLADALLGDTYIAGTMEIIGSEGINSKILGPGGPYTISSYGGKTEELDAIAIYPGFRLSLSYLGTVRHIFEGPLVLTNGHHEGAYGHLVKKVWHEPFQTLFPSSCRLWSTEDMHIWTAYKAMVEVI